MWIERVTGEENQKNTNEKIKSLELMMSSFHQMLKSVVCEYAYCTSASRAGKASGYCNEMPPNAAGQHAFYVSDCQ